MKRAILILAAVATLGLLLCFPGVRCALRGHHRPERKEGAAGFRCLDCPATGHDMEAMGEETAVPPARRVYDRQHGTVTRTSSWEPETARPGRDPGFYRPGRRRGAVR